MSFWDTIKGWIGRKAAFGMIPAWEQGRPQYTPHNYGNFADEGYRKNEIMFSCIRGKATSVAEPRLVAYRLTRGGDRDELPENHPLAILLKRPSPIMTQAQMLGIWSTNLDIAGNVYVAKERTNAGTVGRLRHLRPDRMKVIPDRVKGVGGYEYAVSGMTRRLDAEDVIHDKTYDPQNDYYGLSPIAVAARLGDVDNEGTDFVKRFFEQGAQAPFWLTYKGGRLPAAEKERIRRQMRKQYGGYKKWTEPGILDVDMDILKTGLDFQQMDFKFLRMMSEARICSIFGVPPILVGAEIGLERSTYSNYEEARRSFLSETMKPVWRQIEDALNMGLAPEFGEDILIEFDLSEVQALQEDVNGVWDRATKAFAASGITRNMFLEEIGKDPVDGGDVFLQSMMLMPVPVGEEPQVPAAPENPPEKGQKSGDADWYEQKANRWSQAVNLTAQAWEGRFRDEAKKLFAQEREEVLKLLRKEGKATKQGIAFQKFLIEVENYYLTAGDEWRAAFLPVYSALLQAQGENLGIAFGIQFDVTRPEVFDFLNSYTMHFADEVVETSTELIKGIIFQGQEEGWTVPQMRTGIERLFDDNFERYRAERIARTETIRSSNAGAHEAYRQAGVEKHQWWDGQAGACVFCQEMHKKIIAISEVFFEKGADPWEITDAEGKTHKMTFEYGDVGYPPLHPNCKCTVIPIVEV